MTGRSQFSSCLWPLHKFVPKLRIPGKTASCCLSRLSPHHCQEIAMVNSQVCDRHPFQNSPLLWWQRLVYTSMCSQLDFFQWNITCVDTPAVAHRQSGTVCKATMGRYEERGRTTMGVQGIEVASKHGWVLTSFAMAGCKGCTWMAVYFLAIQRCLCMSQENIAISYWWTKIRALFWLR